MADERTSGLPRLIQESAPLRRKITASLREAIESGRLRGGERLVEKDLCRDLNVSRTSLREAFRELEAEGLLTTHPRGMVVTQVTEQEANNIYKVRAALEALVAGQFAVGADDDARAELKQVLERLRRAYAEKQSVQILKAKKEFYEVLCRGADNLVVLDLLNRLNSRITQLRSASLSDPKRAVASMKEIQELTTALLARDGEATRAAAIAHVEAAARYTARLRKLASAKEETEDGAKEAAVKKKSATR